MGNLIEVHVWHLLCSFLVGKCSGKENMRTVIPSLFALWFGSALTVLPQLTTNEGGLQNHGNDIYRNTVPSNVVVRVPGMTNVVVMTNGLPGRSNYWFPPNPTRQSTRVAGTNIAFPHEVAPPYTHWWQKIF